MPELPSEEHGAEHPESERRRELTARIARNAATWREYGPATLLEADLEIGGRAVHAGLRVTEIMPGAPLSVSYREVETAYSEPLMFFIDDDDQEALGIPMEVLERAADAMEPGTGRVTTHEEFYARFSR